MGASWLPINSAGRWTLGAGLDFVGGTREEILCTVRSNLAQREEVAWNLILIKITRRRMRPGDSRRFFWRLTCSGMHGF